jgi:catechol 2,3-dioxygenase-like lactoylglutathione lyase family enzyme
VADFPVTRAGAILAVSDFGASLRFYRDQLGLTEVARYDDPPYATLTAAAGRGSRWRSRATRPPTGRGPR